MKKPQPTPKAEPLSEPTTQETQFFRHPVKTTRYHSKKTWFKIGASTFLLAVLTGMGTWIGSAVLDWFKNHHFITTVEQADLRHLHWAMPKMEQSLSNLNEQLNPSGSVGKNNSNEVLTAQAK